MSVWRLYFIDPQGNRPEDKREKNVWVNVRAWWRRTKSRTQLACGPGQQVPGGMVALQSWLTSKWWRLQGMCEFGFPFQSLYCLGIIYPFPSSFVSFYPVMVEANDIHLIKMYCGWRCWYCHHISSDCSSYARCSKRKEGMAEEGGRG